MYICRQLGITIHRTNNQFTQLFLLQSQSFGDDSVFTSKKIQQSPSYIDGYIIVMVHNYVDIHMCATVHVHVYVFIYMCTCVCKYTTSMTFCLINFILLGISQCCLDLQTILRSQKQVFSYLQIHGFSCYVILKVNNTVEPLLSEHLCTSQFSKTFG